LLQQATEVKNGLLFDADAFFIVSFDVFADLK
jgi:hypothetical protein